MATGNEWIEHFKKIPRDKVLKISKAIKVLESDDMLRKEYGWTGIFSLGHIAKTIGEK